MNGDDMKCKMCGQEVSGEIIRALGSIFHAACFKCCVCSRNLSNQDIPFAPDNQGRIYCQPDYNEYLNSLIL